MTLTRGELTALEFVCRKSVSLCAGGLSHDEASASADWGGGATPPYPNSKCPTRLITTPA